MKLLLILAAIALPFVSLAGVQAADDDLEMVQSVARPELSALVCLAISPDGKFLYSIGSEISISVFKRDSETGLLEAADVAHGEGLSGALRVRLSPDGRYAALAGSGPGSLTICKRDAETGGLSKFADLSDAVPPTNSSACDANFTSDHHFLYTAERNGGVGVFRLEDEKVTFVQYTESDNFQGARAVTLSPDNHWVYVAGTSSNTLGVFHRDEASGKLETVQMLSNGQDGVSGLQGIFRIAVSKDGKNVYLTAGRFAGDQVISALEVQTDGHLKPIEQIVNGVDDFSEFEGANDLAVSPDGKFVFAVASISDRLFRFSRNPESGKLTFVTSQQAGTFASPGAAGICFSPDGKFVYVADEAEGAIQAYKLR